MSDAVRITTMILMTIIALTSAGTGLFCLYQNHKLNSENYGWGAVCSLIVFCGLAGGIAKIAGIDLKF